MFNWQIGVGDILLILSILGGGALFLFKITSKIDNIEKDHQREHRDNMQKFSNIEHQLSKLVDVTVQLAQQEERIKHIENRFDKLELLLSDLITKLAKPTPTRRKSTR